MKPFVLILSLAVALFRPVLLFVEVNEHLQSSYEAVAHLLVGGLFTAGWLAEGWLVEVDDIQEGRWWCFQVAVGLTVVEIVCAGITIAIR